MIEKMITSRTRVKLLKLFLTHIDDRYYLRELERMLGESLSPLRRQLVKLVKMGILTTEEEANLKYYRLNKNFSGIEDLRRLLLSPQEAAIRPVSGLQPAPLERVKAVTPVASKSQNKKRLNFDVAVLTVVSIVVLLASIFVVYTSTKNIKEVTDLISRNTAKIAEMTARKIASPTRPDEMVSRRWKVIPGNMPVFSSGVTGGGERRDREL